MKKIFIYLFLLSMPLFAYSQPLPDSLKHEYDTATIKGNKYKVLAIYFYSLKGSPIDQLKPVLKLLSYFIKTNDKPGISDTYIYLSELSNDANELDASLKYAIASLPFLEDMKDTAGLLLAYQYAGNSFTNSYNPREAIEYWKKSMQMAKNFNASMYYSDLNDIAGNYNDLKLPDSALPYIQEAVKLCEQAKDTFDLKYFISTLGETYIARGENEIARPFILQSIAMAQKSNDKYALVYDFHDMAQSFFNNAMYDSSLAYAREALVYEIPDFLLRAIDSYKLMYQVFDKENKTDSADKYYRLAGQIKDSLLSDEKNKNIQSQNFQEQIRQQEIEAQQEEIALQHKQNIENALIALGIISFTIFFLLMSRSFIANAKLIRFLGVLALLLVFEFVNLLVHSYVEELTDHSQILMLLLLVGLAALLIPLHHKIEKWAIEKLVEKNKQLRLAAAKKIVERLGEKKESADDVNE